MSAPVYVGKHRDGLNVWGIASTELRGEEAVRVYQMWQRPAGRHYKPCSRCNDSGLRFWTVTGSGSTLHALSALCGCGAQPPQLMNAPVVFSSPSAAATVKAGGVATTNDIGDDTTQPDKGTAMNGCGPDCPTPDALHVGAALDWIGDTPLAHGERSELNGDPLPHVVPGSGGFNGLYVESPDAYCLCGHPNYITCPRAYSEGIASWTVGAA